VRWSEIEWQMEAIASLVGTITPCGVFGCAQWVESTDKHHPLVVNHELDWGPVASNTSLYTFDSYNQLIAAVLQDAKLEKKQTSGVGLPFFATFRSK